MSDASGLLGLAARARAISSGEMVYQHIRSRKAYLVVMADDIGPNSKKKLSDKCEYYHIPFVYMNVDSLNQAIGMHNRKCVAVLDEGFAQKLHTCLKG